MRAWCLLGVLCEDGTLRAEHHPCAMRLPFPSARFSCDCNIFRQKFTDSARHLKYLSVVHEVEGALPVLQSLRLPLEMVPGVHAGGVSAAECGKERP